MKLMGITLDNKLSWSKHVENTLKRMVRVLAEVRRCRKYFTFDIMKIILDKPFSSQLDYCQIIWANATKKDLRKLQLVQYKSV